MKITLLHPSRGRAEKALATFNFWKANANWPEQIEHIISLDEDDKEVMKYRQLFPNSTIIVSKNTCVVEATNVAAVIAKGEILVYLSDDFLCPKMWDVAIAEKFGDNKKPLLVKVDDCLQKFEVAVLTIPIMNKELYRTLGYFWHPAYKSMFVDEDLYWTCKNNNWMVLAGELKFPHEHCSIGKAEKDETYTRSEANWNQGKEAFAKRKEQNFPL